MKKQMFSGYKIIHKLILVMVALVVALTTGLASVPAFAADEKIINKKKGNPVLENIGFMKNPPKELTERFPMCHAFLEVKWIDKEKKIGYTKYEAILTGKKAKFKGERKTVSALVIMGDSPTINIDLRKYDSQGRLNELFDAVRNGKITWLYNWRIEYKGDTFELYDSDVVDISLENYPLLTENRQNVCVAYPDEKRAWIIEGKSVKQTYSKRELQELSKRIIEMQIRPEEVETPKGVFPNAKFVSPQNEVEAWVEDLWVLDVNHDGKVDYIGGRTASFIIYSWSDKLYQVRNGYTKSGNTPYGVLIYPPSNRLCTIFPPGGLGILTTDGTNYYLDNQCNLTELTSPTVK